MLVVEQGSMTHLEPDLGVQDIKIGHQAGDTLHLYQYRIFLLSRSVVVTNAEIAILEPYGLCLHDKRLLTGRCSTIEAGHEDIQVRERIPLIGLHIHHQAFGLNGGEDEVAPGHLFQIQQGGLY